MLNFKMYIGREESSNMNDDNIPKKKEPKRKGQKKKRK